MGKTVKLRGDPWEALFPHALTLMDEVKAHGGGEPFWTFGGGTVLMLRYDHRVSKDIDIFVPDPQYLGFVTPRLSDVAEAITADYVEQGNFVKLVLESGEVDFVASPNLTAEPFEVWEIMGRPVRVETAAEIVAKKLYHRGDRATARDLFDLAVVVEQDRDALERAAPFLLRHADTFMDQVVGRRPILEKQFAQIERRQFARSYDDCVVLAKDLFAMLDSAKGRKDG